MPAPEPQRIRRLLIVLGDQLDEQAGILSDADPAQDRVWMAEVAQEATHVPSHPARIALFFSAMRHFSEQLRARGLGLIYHRLETHSHADLGAALQADLERLQPAEVAVTEPGEYRVRKLLTQTCTHAGIPLEIATDRHFLCTTADFARWVSGRKQPRLEHFYRHLRRQTGVLMQANGEPAGGKWNYDASNRASFGRQGPGLVPAAVRFRPDALTAEVLSLVGDRFADHPGRLDDFDWPVTRAQARAALDDFITHRLTLFGRWQDAMWTGYPLLYHARISAALNLKLLDPREVIAAAEQAWQSGAAPLEAVEGFIRQVLGWREYVRGLYWHAMPDYLQHNALQANEPLPAFYWTAETPMACLRAVIDQTLALGYAHHIQRLMVTGLFALLLGVVPREVHRWYLAVYVDAVEWVELPNTLGMSQFADGGLLGSKPYAASGAYIQRMSNYCQGCAYDPKQATGPRACPFTTLYWDFLQRHRDRFERHPRAAMQWRNLQRLDADRLSAIQQAASALRERLRAGEGA